MQPANRFPLSLALELFALSLSADMAGFLAVTGEESSVVPRDAVHVAGGGGVVGEARVASRVGLGAVEPRLSVRLALLQKVTLIYLHTLISLFR
jgi:hypothetical protein